MPPNVGLPRSPVRFDCPNVSRESSVELLVKLVTRKRVAERGFRDILHPFAALGQAAPHRVGADLALEQLHPKARLGHDAVPFRRDELGAGDRAGVEIVRENHPDNFLRQKTNEVSLQKGEKGGVQPRCENANVNIEPSAQ